MGRFSLNSADILCIVAAIAGSLHIIFVEKVAKNDNVDSTLFTVFLLAFISLWGTIIGFFIGRFKLYGCNSRTSRCDFFP